MSDIELLCKNAIDVIDRGDLEARLREGKQLRVKAGFDPSAPDIHLGHTVLLRKLRQFQDLGHKVIFIVGDFTAMIGDPTGQTKTRPALDDAAIVANAKTYQEQAFKILDKDPKKIEVVRNSDWIGKLALRDFMRDLAARATVARILERDDFQKRMAEKQPLSLLEMLYPLFQGYDSVAVKADIELGGSDQKFNLLMGRDLQKDFGQRPQIVMTFPLLVGLDGKAKMSKSLGNYIAVNDSAKDMFGKAMSIPDELMPMYYELLTAQTVPLGHPMDAKKNLAKLITASYYGDKAGQDQLGEFERVFSKKQDPTDAQKTTLQAHDQSEWQIVDLLKYVEAAKSGSDGRRLVEQGAVSINGKKILDPKLIIKLKSGDLLKVGKYFFTQFVVD